MEFKSQFLEKEQLYNKLLNYPPFFTLQDHAETRSRQITYWSEITHLHFKKSKILESSFSELGSDTFALYSDNSTGIPKRLTKDEIRVILQEMERLGTIVWKNDLHENFTVNWTSPFELADAIYQWAKDNKLIGYTETLKGISSGEQTDAKLSKPNIQIFFFHTEFYELPEQQILKACQVLEQTGRAEVYEFDGLFSVKFK